MFVCLGFGHFILFVYFFPWPRSSKGPRMGRQLDLLSFAAKEKNKQIR